MINKLKIKNAVSTDRQEKLKIYSLTFVIFICFLSIFSLNVYSQARTATASPTITSTATQEDKEIQSLKDKIATKVAELREKNVKAVNGVVQEIKPAKNPTSLKIKNLNNDIYDIKIDPDLTKFFQISSGVKKEAESSDIEKDSYIVVTGVIKDKTVEANFIYLDELFIVGTGKVTEANSDDFFVSVITSDKENYTLDVERTTKQQLLNIKTLVPENAGFSKIKEGDSIHFVAKVSGNEKEVNRYSATKILTIPQEYFIK